MNANEIVSSVVASLSTMDDAGNVVAFDLDGLKEVIKGLQSVGKEARIADKDKAKEDKKLREKNEAIVGKAYYDALLEGDEFSYKDASGKILTGKKILTKSKTGSTAAMELNEIPEGSKTAKRYPKFHQLVVPAGFEMPKTEQVA